jgi:hypothetical protein
MALPNIVGLLGSAYLGKQGSDAVSQAQLAGNRESNALKKSLFDQTVKLGTGATENTNTSLNADGSSSTLFNPGSGQKAISDLSPSLINTSANDFFAAKPLATNIGDAKALFKSDSDAARGLAQDAINTTALRQGQSPGAGMQNTSLAMSNIQGLNKVARDNAVNETANAANFVGTEADRVAKLRNTILNNMQGSTIDTTKPNLGNQASGIGAGKGMPDLSGASTSASLQNLIGQQLQQQALDDANKKSDDRFNRLLAGGAFNSGTRG